jgi:hypothetical protein
MTSLPLSTTAARDPSVREPKHATTRRDPRHDSLGKIDERRGATRYTTKDTPALIGWLDGGVGHKFISSLKNISAGGALFETEFQTPPPLETLVMVRLFSNATDWVMRAKVVGVTTPRAPGRFSFRRKQERAGHQVRLEFLESCPYEFFKASISGFVVERMGGEPMSGTFDA